VARKEQVLLVVDLSEKGVTPRRVVGVLRITRAEGVKLNQAIDRHHRGGSLRGCCMVPAVATLRSFKETIALLE
jgi:hypothetical protein